MESRATPLLIIVGIAVAFILCLYGLGNLMCRGSVRNCTLNGEECPNGTMCVAYENNVSRCSPHFCPTVLEQNKNVSAFWKQEIEPIVKSVQGWFRNLK